MRKHIKVWRQLCLKMHGVESNKGKIVEAVAGQIYIEISIKSPQLPYLIATTIRNGNYD